MKMLIGADLVSATAEVNTLFANGDVKTLFNDVAEVAKTANRFIVNLECALTTTEQKIKKYGPCLKADPKTADTLKTLGVTDVVLSNNHVFDFGVHGLTDTLDNLNRVGIPYTGVGKDNEDARKIYYFEQNGKKIALVNVCEHEYSYALPDRMGTNAFDPFVTMQDIRTAKKQADFVIVLYHGGKEHCRYPSPRLRNLCREMVYCGANVVLTQHSHCIGCYEQFEGGHILYGQGNFHFCLPERTDELWNTSLLVALDINDTVEISFIPIITEKTSIRLAKGKEYDDIMTPFAQRNEELKNGEWIAGWKAFCARVKEQYASFLFGESALSDPEIQAQRLAHYLDCEAHLDVLLEIYPTWNQTNEK